MSKKVYVSLIGDLIHAGHINIINTAAKYGEVTVGLLTDKAAGELNDVPYIDYESRKSVIEAMANVAKVIPQRTASYRENIKMLRPDYVVHGDDWKSNNQKKYRTEVIELLQSYGSPRGELIEVPFSNCIHDAKIKDKKKSLGITSTHRLGRLRKLIASKPIVKIMEVHNAISGLIVENVKSERDGEDVSYDGMWGSSLTDSTAKGKPDIELVDISARAATINEIFEVTTKPMIFDADTGGKIEHFEFTVKTLERLGVSAAIIEDKTGLKRNSLFGNSVPQTQDSIENFCKKIRAGKASQLTEDFMIIARIESLILEAGIEDALTRAHAYVEAGVDGIMIHSRNKSPDEIFEFVKKFRSENKDTPIVVVPSSYNTVTIEEFQEIGVNVVIYANHMLRSAYPSMVGTAEKILENGRSQEVEEEGRCLSIKEIINLIGI